MAENANISEKCMYLARKVVGLGTAINGRRNAQILFSQLCEATSDLGAGISAINYLPARSMRSQQSIEMVKCAQKVIFMLNLALREGVFLKKPTTEALNLAISVANDINALVQAYVTGAPAPAVGEVSAPSDSAEEGTEKPSDPDGFNAPYEG